MFSEHFLAVEEFAEPPSGAESSSIPAKFASSFKNPTKLWFFFSDYNPEAGTVVHCRHVAGSENYLDLPERALTEFFLPNFFF